MMRRFVLLLCLVLVYAIPALAEIKLELPENAMNGRAFFAKIVSNSDLPVVLEWNEQRVKVFCNKKNGRYEGLALLPLTRGYAKNNIQISATEVTPDGINSIVKTIPVTLKKYREQRLKVNRKYVDLDKKSLDKHYTDRAEVTSMMQSLSNLRMWEKGFERPVAGGLNSEFGVQRFFNGKPRKAHSGVDLRGKKGTPIKACAGGVVRIANNHFFSGQSVYIDHGQGVVSMYFHMSKMIVKQGEAVKKGQVIGLVGATGRVTGPHLHFGLNISGIAIDPMPLFANSK